MSKTCEECLNLREKILTIITEINCRIEHGVDGKLHLKYFEKELKNLIKYK